MEIANDPEAASSPESGRVRWPGVVAVVLVVVLVVLAVPALVYRRQIISYVTHRKDGPSVTWPFVAHDPAPTVHLAIVGDGGDGGSRIDATGSAVARIGAVEP